MRKQTISRVVERLRVAFGDLIILDESTYVSIGKKCRFIHSKYGEWWTTPSKVFQGQVPLKGREDKKKSVWLKKYGVDHPSKNSIVRERIVKANKSRTIPLAKIEEMLFRKYGKQIVIDGSTYISMKKNAVFIDFEHGSWKATPDNVLRGHGHAARSNEKKQKTSLKRNGCAWPAQNREIALKQAKAANKVCTKIHWKTLEELICQASYESKVVDYLNQEKIDFKWQPEIFTMPNGKTYRPDLFLVNENKWIEIKGWLRKDAQEKWDWFKTQFPKAELWNEEKLKEMGLL